MANFPIHRDAMRRARYEFIGIVRCATCNAEVEKWKTTHGRFILFNLPQNPVNQFESTVAHYSVCKPAKREPRTESRRSEVQTKERQGGRQSAVEELQACFNPQLVIMVFDDSVHFAYRRGLPPEDARNEIISAANAVRQHLQEGK